MLLQLIAGLLLIVAWGGTARAANVPFVENFAQDAAGWRNGAGTADLQWIGAGGRDGGSYASGTLSFLNVTPNGTPLVARAQEEWSSSNGAFAGNYIQDGVQELRVWVRHDAPAPLTYFVRFSGPANFPGAIAVSFAPVPPNLWTEITVPIDPANPQFVTFEGSSFQTVFSNVGHVQIGLLEPAVLAGQDLTFAFDIDQVVLSGAPAQPVPAVSAAGLAVLIILLGTTAWSRFRRPIGGRRKSPAA